MNWTGLQQVDLVTRQVHWYRSETRMDGLSQFMHCEHSRWNTHGQNWSSV